MVEGMKNELRAYVAAGGTIAGYCKRIVRRQDEEIGYYNRVKTEIETASERKLPTTELLKLWKERNDELRAMGIKLIAMPEK